jgi:hypothetical protein
MGNSHRAGIIKSLSELVFSLQYNGIDDSGVL